MATDADPSTIINLSDSLGPILAAVFVSLMFYGVSILQTFLYYERYTQDPITLKSLVASVFALDTANIVLMCAGVWQPFILHFGDGNFLLYTHAPLIIAIIVASVVSTTVQSFFIYRVWFLTKSRFRWLFPFILAPFVVAQLVMSTFYAVIALPPQTNIAIISEPLLMKVAFALKGVATGVDVIITISLCTLLVMGRTGFENTDRMLLRLIFITVNTGLSCALFSFLSSILLAIYPDNLIFTALYYPLCSVYCNTLLASLNARSFVRGSIESPHPSERRYGRLEPATLLRMPNRLHAAASHRSSHRDSPILEIVRPSHSLAASVSEGPCQARNYDCCWIGESPRKNRTPPFAPEDMYGMT